MHEVIQFKWYGQIKLKSLVVSVSSWTQLFCHGMRG